MSTIAERLVAARRRDEAAAEERRLLEARRQREQNTLQAMRASVSDGAGAFSTASSVLTHRDNAHRDNDAVVASVRATVLQSGRKPWWENPDATVESRASLTGKAQRQAAMRSGTHSELSAASRALTTQRALKARRSTSLGPSIAAESASDKAGGVLSSSARYAANRLNSGLPAGALTVSMAARREIKPPPQPIDAEEVAQMLQARLLRRREHAVSEVTLRPPGSRG